jgi:hypothetical protein
MQAVFSGLGIGPYPFAGETLLNISVQSGSRGSPPTTIRPDGVVRKMALIPRLYTVYSAVLQMKGGLSSEELTAAAASQRREPGIN